MPLMKTLLFDFQINFLHDRLCGIMTGRHFHANMKVQTATCKDNDNSKSRAATCMKFEINMK